VTASERVDYRAGDTVGAGLTRAASRVVWRLRPGTLRHLISY